MIWLVFCYCVGTVLAMSFIVPWLAKEFDEPVDAMTWALSFMLGLLWPLLMMAWAASIPARWLIRKRTEIK